MKNKKVAFILMSVVLLTGCAQSTVFLVDANLSEFLLMKKEDLILPQ